MKINPLEKHPKMNALFTTAMTLAAAYLGYEKVEQRVSPVEVEVVVPDQKEHSHAHSHKQKDWLPVIREEIEKAVESNNETYH